MLSIANHIIKTLEGEMRYEQQHHRAATMGN